jgi:hypothetical protein
VEESQVDDANVMMNASEQQEDQVGDLQVAW